MSVFHHSPCTNEPRRLTGEDRGIDLVCVFCAPVGRDHFPGVRLSSVSVGHTSANASQYPSQWVPSSSVVCALCLCFAGVCVYSVCNSTQSPHWSAKVHCFCLCGACVCVCVRRACVRAVRMCVVSVWPILTKFYYGVIFSPCHVIPTHSGRLKIIF